MKGALIIPYFLFVGGVSFGQHELGVKLLAKAKSQSILLRWAPTNDQSWIEGNQNGYIVERFLISKKNEVVKTPEKTLLTQVPVRPKPLPQWKNDAEKNDFSAVAAQAIYGNTFQVKIPQNESFTEITNRSKEQEQRFLFALFAADHSFQTAKLSALGFEDTTVKKDERYLYRVYLASQDAKIKRDTALFYIGLQDIVGLIPPLNVTAQFADRQVLLRWPKSFVQHIYTSFLVERSADGIEFNRRNSTPYVNASSSTQNEDFYQMLDSLPQNGVEYQYRVRGITPFGEIGPESERISGRGIQTLEARAIIDKAIEQKGKVFIEWRLAGNTKKVADRLYVERANDDDKTFQTLHNRPLAITTVSYVDEFPQSSNYYRIKILGENGQVSTSFPVLVQLVDSIPPTRPMGLNAKVDTTGVTLLTWSQNTEKDLLGYKVYRSNFLNAEFTEVSPVALSATKYLDSLNVKNLNTKICYKIAAFDKRMNRSVYSEVVIAELPDVIPPLPPSITEISQDRKGIFLAWSKSSSDDVAKYELEKKDADSVQWWTAKVFNSKDSSFYLDQSTRSKHIYHYRLFSVDNNKLKSIPSNTVSGTSSRVDANQGVVDLSAQIDRQNKSILLQWRRDRTAVKYLIYRGVRDGLLTLYRSVPAERSNFADASVEMNTNYRYRVRCVFEDGSESRFSEELKIQY